VNLSYAVWGIWFAAFIALELLAVFHVAPWKTLSSTAWDLQVRWEWLTVPILAGLSVLLGHIVRWRNIRAGAEKKENE